MLRNWDLEGCILGITTDQGSNVKKAMREYQDEHDTAWIPCASHKIQLCINDAIKGTPTVSAVFGKCQLITALFSKSTIASEALDDQQTGRGKTPIKLKKMNTTRWNSKYLMGESVDLISDEIAGAAVRLLKGTKAQVEQGEALTKILLNNAELAALQEVLALLKPSVGFTHWVGSSKTSTIAEIYPRVLSLVPPVGTVHTPTAVAFHATFTECIQDRWSLASMPDAVLLAIFFHPAICTSEGYLDSTLYADNSNQGPDKPLFAKAVTLAIRLFIKYLEQKQMKRCGVDADADRIEFCAQFSVMLYVKDVRRVNNGFSKYRNSPQEFWLNRQETFGYEDLSGFALDYLGVQGTSSESERTFSKAGLILNAKATRTSDATMQDIMLAKSLGEAIPLLREFHQKEALRLKKNKP